MKKQKFTEETINGKNRIKREEVREHIMFKVMKSN